MRGRPADSALCEVEDGSLRWQAPLHLENRLIRITDKKGELIMSCHDDAAILVFEEGRGRCFTPEGLDMDHIPDHVLFATSIAAYARTEEGVRTIMTWMTQQQENEDGGPGNGPSPA